MGKLAIDILVAKGPSKELEALTARFISLESIADLCKELDQHDFHSVVTNVESDVSNIFIIVICYF